MCSPSQVIIKFMLKCNTYPHNLKQLGLINRHTSSGMIEVPWQIFLFFCLILPPQFFNIYRKLLDIIDTYFETEEHHLSLPCILLKRKINFLHSMILLSWTAWHEISSHSFSCSDCGLNIDHQIHSFVHEQTYHFYLNCTKHKVRQKVQQD